MLSASLHAVQQLLTTVSSLPASSPTAATVQADILETGTGLLPQLSAARERLAADTAAAGQQIVALRARVAVGGTQAAGPVVQELGALGVVFATQKERLGVLVRQVNDFRDQTGVGVGTLTAEQARVNTQLSVLTTRHDELVAKAGPLQTENTVTTILGFFFPIVKAADELASAIQYGKSTEAELADVTGQLADVSRQAQALSAASGACSLLATGLGNLQVAAQNLLNAITLVSGDLASDAARAKVATPETLVLYLASLTTAMTVLADGAR